jgi:hypothetical protein
MDCGTGCGTGCGMDFTGYGMGCGMGCTSRRVPASFLPRGGRMSDHADHLWAVIPACLYCLLSLDIYARDIGRVCAWVLARVLRVGATWR